MLKFDKKVVKLGLRILKNLDYQIGIGRKKSNRKCRYKNDIAGRKAGRSLVGEDHYFGGNNREGS